MSYVKGSLSSSEITGLKPDVSSELSLLDVNRYPLVALLTNFGKDPVLGTGKSMKKESCGNHKFEWYEKEYAAVADAINNGAGYAASAVSVVVDNGAYFNLNDIVLVPRTSERVQVTDISTDTLTITRSIGTTAAAALVDDEPLFIIGNAFGQSSDSATASYLQKSAKYNYTQIFKKSIDLSGTHEAETTYTGKTRDEERVIKGVEHMVDIERAFMFGERGSGTDKDGKECYYTGGVIEKITTNIQNESSSTLTEDEFESFLGDYAFKYGSLSKYMFASSVIISAINKFARDDLETVPGEKVFGVQIKKYLSPHGELMLIKEPLFTGTIYGGFAVVLDMKELTYKYLQSRDTQYQKNIQTKGNDSYKDQYLTECGLEARLEKAHAILKGVSAS